MSDKKEIVSASPKVRKLAREFGADIYQIQGSQREGRVSESDVKTFIKESITGKIEKKQTSILQQYDHSEFGEIDVQPIPRIKKLLDRICKSHGMKFPMLHNMMKPILPKWRNLENL